MRLVGTAQKIYFIQNGPLRLAAHKSGLREATNHWLRNMGTKWL
jgi:hypothetical protein